MNAKTSLLVLSDLIGKIGERAFLLACYLGLLALMLAAVIGPYWVASLILTWSLAASTMVRSLVIGVLLLLLLTWSLFISGDRVVNLFRWIRDHGIKAPFLISLSLLFYADLCFAALSGLLADLRIVRFEPHIAGGEFLKLQDFYLWHFLNLIPGLKIPDTLLWRPPFEYKDPLSGALLLLFDVVVILPVIASFKVSSRIGKEMAQRKKDDLALAD